MLTIKQFFIILSLSSITACGLLPAKFDNNEYMHLVYLNIAADSQQGCNRIETESILFYSKFLYRYSKHTTNNNITETYEKLYNWAAELSSKESPSDVYCNIKKKNIKEVTDRALEVYGGRIR